MLRNGVSCVHNLTAMVSHFLIFIHSLKEIRIFHLTLFTSVGILLRIDTKNGQFLVGLIAQLLEQVMGSNPIRT